jgi:hypothetical protein
LLLLTTVFVKDFRENSQQDFSDSLQSLVEVSDEKEEGEI